MTNGAKYLPAFSGCMVCGQKNVNPNSLSLRFRVTKQGVQVPFTPQKIHQGYDGIVHGGIIAALLDETIGWAVAVARNKYFMTGELTIRFLKPLSVGQEITVSGRAVEHKNRYSVAEGEIVDANGTVFAKASGKFFLMTDEQALKVDSYLTYKSDTLRILT